jgi:hypothetical protein
MNREVEKMSVTMAGRLLTFSVLASFFVVGAGLADDESKTRSFKARLDGFEETPFTLSTTGTGEFRARLNESENQLSYELEYSGLEGTVTMAHVHFGARGLSGGVMFWLCTTSTAPIPAPLGTPTCPSPGGKVTGTITSAQIVGPSGQGIAAGEFAEVIRAMRAGAAYANVHSSLYPGGEIRGQINRENPGKALGRGKD